MKIETNYQKNEIELMETTRSRIINLVYKTSFSLFTKNKIYIYIKHKRERDRRLQKRRKVTRAKKWSYRKKKKHTHEQKLVYPLTFCPAAELNEPFGVPFGCRQPFCIGIGVAFFVVGGEGSTVVLLLLSSIIG
jgi:hypothetical protein